MNVTYLLRRVQSLLSREREADAPQELLSALQQCKTVEQMLDFFFTTDFRVDEGFTQLFEKRLQELDRPL